MGLDELFVQKNFLRFVDSTDDGQISLTVLTPVLGPHNPSFERHSKINKTNKSDH